MGKMSYVFISYSRYDAPFVDRLANDLRKCGVQPWTDRENIAPGKSWQSEIERGLKNATLTIFVISSNSLKSPWMLAELGAFWETKKKIIPAVIEDVDVSALPASIYTIQWADFRQSYDNGLKSLLSGIGADLSDKIPVSGKAKKTKGYAFLSYAEEDIDFVSSLKVFLEE